MGAGVFVPWSVTRRLGECVVGMQNGSTRVRWIGRWCLVLGALWECDGRRRMVGECSMNGRVAGA